MQTAEFGKVRKQRHCMGEVVRPKDGKGQSNKGKAACNTEKIQGFAQYRIFPGGEMAAVLYPPPDAGEHLHDGMKKTPQDEGPACTVPDTADKKYCKYIDKSSYKAPAVSAQGDVNISGEEAPQGHVPTLPEFYKIL